MAKEKNFNPVQEHKKSEKQKQIKKQKASVQAQRNERLARRNPARIQRDIDQLKELEQSGEFRPHDRQKLAQLEKDLAAVNKARTALGDKAPQFKEAWRNEGGDRGGRGGYRGRGGAGVLGKRRRDGSWKGRDGEESSDTDADVANIPMPRDTPPPIPPRNRERNSLAGLGDDALPEPKKPTIVYESAPQVRDLQKEAAQFVPAAVAAKRKLAKGDVQGKLMEPEEFDKLEREGYLGKEKEVSPANQDLEEFIRGEGVPNNVVAQKAVEAAVEEAERDMMAAEANGEMDNPRSSDKAAERSLRHVEMEEVEDEDL
ncbi:WW domain binding protein 11-domain-containing protein [Clohesyomyces aquaticus]|uniref:WW domain binding protein 11-domain-containing protein n=1 Tax=Clohesyomyces aquaticus TaxID=1231657 RepID=A0A1Y1YRD1_9PLEO|nr:WW domain binding protein 11-domain-containing protein [Clohesyomyces aquaticus]